MSAHLFFQSALINSLIFLWVASAISAIRILLRCHMSTSMALLLGIALGPVAFVGAWILEPRVKNRSGGSISSVWLDPPALSAIILIALLVMVSFYAALVANSVESSSSSEAIMQKSAILMAILGTLGGIVAAIFTRRVAFFEACWVTCLVSLSTLLLEGWADESFSYGTSVAYFTSLILSSLLLLLVFLCFGGALGFVLFGEGRFNAGLGYERFVGIRFLKTKRSSRVVSLITVISVVAVMIACMGMIVVMSVMNGFTTDLRSKILGANAHLMVLKYGSFADYQSVIEKTESIEGVASASAFIVNEGMVSSNKNLSGAIITGIDVHRLDRSGRLKYVGEKALSYLKDPTKIPAVFPLMGEDALNAIDTGGKAQENELPAVILGKEMANYLGVFVGDIVNLISPVGDMGPTGPIPKAKPFRVAGNFYAGMYDFDSKFAYISLKDAQDFFNLSEVVTGVEYRLSDIDNTRRVAKEIDKAIGGYPFYLRDWMQMNRPMFSALQLEKIAMLIILGTLIFMASLLILVTLIMVVMEKGKEIAILKSMGATDVSIMKVFVTYGLTVGGLGAILGGALGISVCFLIEKIGIRLDPDVYYFSNLPVVIDHGEVFTVVFAAILVSFLATIPPALFAARQKPVEGLRYI